MKKYSETHEWIELEGSDVALMGISNHAQTLLGDIAFVELPAVGAKFKQGEPLGVIESVKSASDFYAPVSGTVIAINEAMAASPADLNGQAESMWLVKIKLTDPAEMDGLMHDVAYISAL